MQDQIVAAAQQAAVESQVSCVDAHAIAASLGVAPIVLGRMVTENTSLRFNRCQLGLFGYGSKAEGRSKIVLPAAYVPPEIEAALREHLVDGAIPCIRVWQIADRFKYPRLGMANIVQALGFKVAPCQLGCF